MTPKPKTKTIGRSIDVATLFGIALAACGIVGGLLLEGGQMQDIVQGTAAVIVLGGTLGAVMVTTPGSVLRRALKNAGTLFWERKQPVGAVIDELIGYAAKARRSGLVSLEAESLAIADPFLHKAMTLAVDGTDLQELRKMMELDISIGEQFGEAEARVYESAGGYSPTIGIIGAVLGLIQVMKHLENIREVGHGIAVAFVATVYGVGAANVLFLPAANKLRARVHHDVLMKELALEGVLGILEGLNPKLLRVKLEAYTLNQPTSKKPQGPAKAAVPPAAGPVRTGANAA